MKTYEPNLGYFKKGDDLTAMIGQAKSLTEALAAHATMLEEDAKILRRLAGLAAEEPSLQVDADCHMINLSGPEERLEALVAEGVVQVFDLDEDDDEDTEEPPS